MKKRILDLEITQKEAARLLGVHATTVANLLKERGAPDLRLWPKVIQFLGYDPQPEPRNVGQALRKWRQARGQSQEELAAELQVDPGTLARSERGERRPTGEYLVRVNTLLNENRVP